MIALLCFCLLAALIPEPLNTEHPLLSYLQGRIAAATPAVLWLFAHTLFVDDRRVSPVAWLFLIGYQLARGIAVYSVQINSTENAVVTVLTVLGLLIAFGLAVDVIIMATRELRHDLLEPRKRIRGPFAAGLGLVMALLVAVLLSPEFMSETGAAGFGQAVVSICWLLIFVFFLSFNLLSFRLAPDSQFIVDSAEVDADPKTYSQLQLDESDLELMRELDRRMLQEKFFTEPELTIGQLAALLSVQEYKLRVIINRELGYKNFNQFLNHYRIHEACLLLEKKSKHRNISIVAQDVGYSSLSTFNHAFKKLKGVTPSEFKASHAVE
ncbi:MAG: helix-turn-helix transcriptional regulator [Pseudohongiellaceae bacterium]